MSDIQNISNSLMLLKRFENYQIVRSFSVALAVFAFLRLIGLMFLILNIFLNTLFIQISSIKQVIIIYSYCLQFFIEIAIFGYIIINFLHITFIKNGQKQLLIKIENTKSTGTFIVTQLEKKLIYSFLIICLLDILLVSGLFLGYVYVYAAFAPGLGRNLENANLYYSIVASGNIFITGLYFFKFFLQLIIVGYIIINYLNSRKAKNEHTISFLDNEKNLILSFLIVCLLDSLIIFTILGTIDPLLNGLSPLLNVFTNILTLNNVQVNTPSFIVFFQIYSTIMLQLVIMGYVIFTILQLKITKNDSGILTTSSQNVLGISLLIIWVFDILSSTLYISFVTPILFPGIFSSIAIPAGPENFIEIPAGPENFFGLIIYQTLAYQISVIFFIVIIFFFLKILPTKIFSFRGLIIACIFFLSAIVGFFILVFLFYAHSTNILQYIGSIDAGSLVNNFFAIIILILCSFYLYYKSKAILDGTI